MKEHILPSWSPLSQNLNWLSTLWTAYWLHWQSPAISSNLKICLIQVIKSLQKAATAQLDIMRRNPFPLKFTRICEVVHHRRRTWRLRRKRRRHRQHIMDHMMRYESHQLESYRASVQNKRILSVKKKRILRSRIQGEFLQLKSCFRVWDPFRLWKCLLDSEGSQSFHRSDVYKQQIQDTPPGLKLHG